MGRRDELRSVFTFLYAQFTAAAPGLLYFKSPPRAPTWPGLPCFHTARPDPDPDLNPDPDPMMTDVRNLPECRGDAANRQRVEKRSSIYRLLVKL